MNLWALVFNIFGFRMNKLWFLYERVTDFLNQVEIEVLGFQIGGGLLKPFEVENFGLFYSNMIWLCEPCCDFGES